MRNLGYLLLFILSPLFLVFMFAKAMWDEGYGLHLFIGTLIFIAFYSEFKPPFY